MKFWVFAIVLACVVTVSRCQESEHEVDSTEESWWTGFKNRVKSVLSKWKADIKLLWDDVLTKADDMRGWTAEVFDAFKRKMKEWIETRPDLPDDEKNEIETFISKLKVPTEKPTEKPKNIDP